MILKKATLMLTSDRESLFSDLPPDYICPVCGAGKEEFEVYE